MKNALIGVIFLFDIFVTAVIWMLLAAASGWHEHGVGNLLVAILVAGGVATGYFQKKERKSTALGVVVILLPVEIILLYAFRLIFSIPT